MACDSVSPSSLAQGASSVAAHSQPCRMPAGLLAGKVTASIQLDSCRLFKMRPFLLISLQNCGMLPVATLLLEGTKAPSLPPSCHAGPVGSVPAAGQVWGPTAPASMPPSQRDVDQYVSDPTQKWRAERFVCHQREEREKKDAEDLGPGSSC